MSCESRQQILTIYSTMQPFKGLAWCIALARMGAGNCEHDAGSCRAEQKDHSSPERGRLTNGYSVVLTHFSPVAVAHDTPLTFFTKCSRNVLRWKTWRLLRVKFRLPSSARRCCRSRVLHRVRLQIARRSWRFWYHTNVAGVDISPQITKDSLWSSR